MQMIYFYIWRWRREQELLVMFCLQMILNFPQRDCLGTRKVSKLHCLESYWLSFPLFMFNHCNKLSIKTLKHTIFSMKIPHWHQILVIFMIYALLSRNFDVRIYALFPQIFGNWKVDSADFFTFRMYAPQAMKIGQNITNIARIANAIPRNP